MSSWSDSNEGRETRKTVERVVREHRTIASTVRTKKAASCGLSLSVFEPGPTWLVIGDGRALG